MTESEWLGEETGGMGRVGKVGRRTPDSLNHFNFSYFIFFLSMIAPPYAIICGLRAETMFQFYSQKGYSSNYNFYYFLKKFNLIFSSHKIHGQFNSRMYLFCVSREFWFLSKKHLSSKFNNIK